MKRLLSVFPTGFLVLVLVAYVGADGTAATDRGEAPRGGAEHGLALSDMQIQVTSQGHTATFRLYDTAAARELYDQLPLELDLTNFRDAQWMFYPPKRLRVTAHEAYHDGKKGELSYYEPWGDVFMLYKDFYAGDQMHRLGAGLSGIEEIAAMSGRAKIEKHVPNR